ncbi:hypothetical protein [Marinomonas colpomeniae]|uniref:Uncharacterized protein n=1 Tax=Marinomonas colpomeniae TaxID=2774408 RepID=A0ABR8NWN9_9GAMM|nr:hypothetical protein [Marinomonas colpomeniae]MBD5769457.1 hypothetical protein [Marinomonas colpomeniae]
MKILDNLIVQSLDDLLPKKIISTIYKICDLRNKELSEVGVKLTVIYFVSVIIIILFLDAKRPAELSGYGDFLAGFFSPVAFGWLVIGYLMQNRELVNQLHEYQNNLLITKSQLEHQKNIEINRIKERKLFARPYFRFENVRIIKTHKITGIETEIKNKEIGIYEDHTLKIVTELSAVKNEIYNLELIKETSNRGLSKIGKYSMSTVGFPSIITMDYILRRTHLTLNQKNPLSIDLKYEDIDMLNHKRKIMLFMEYADINGDHHSSVLEIRLYESYIGFSVIHDDD